MDLYDGRKEGFFVDVYEEVSLYVESYEEIEVYYGREAIFSVDVYVYVQ